jgi:hypothetical protein
MNRAEIMFTGHAIQRMFERRISKDEVVKIIKSGSKIIDYPDDKPFPSYLILGYLKKLPIHVVVAQPKNSKTIFVITVYIPDSSIWDSDFKNRRKK